MLFDCLNHEMHGKYTKGGNGLLCNPPPFGLILIGRPPIWTNVIWTEGSFGLTPFGLTPIGLTPFGLPPIWG